MLAFLSEQLRKPHNSHVYLALKTALNLRLPPTVFLFDTKKDATSWDRYDKKLAMAWQVMQDETDPDTNLPIWLAYSTDSNVSFEVKKKTNYAKAELEKYQEKENKKENKRKQFGEVLYLEPVAYTGKLPTREDYFKSLSEAED